MDRPEVNIVHQSGGMASIEATPSPSRDFGAIALLVMLGLQAMVVQIILIRESLVIFQGNELCFGVVFAAWLLGIALGANVGARVAGGKVRGDQVTLVCLLIMALLPLGQVYMIRIQRLWLHVPPGELAPFTSLLASAVLTITPFSAFVGFVFPFAYQLFHRWAEQPATAIGRLYVVEAGGSVLGGLLFTYYVAGRIDAFTALSISGMVLCLLVMCFAAGPSDGADGRLLITAAYLTAFLGSLLLGGVMAQKNQESVVERWRSFNANLTYVASVDSRYENLLVARKENQFSLFGNGQYMFSFPDEPTYAQQAGLVMSQHPNPKNVLLLGGGAGGLLRQILSHPGLARLDYVELDPALISLVRKFLPQAELAALNDKRVHVWYEDGRRFVKRTQERYDLIFVNLPDPSTAMINRFYTRDFFCQAKARMNPGGVLATRISSAIGYLGEEVGCYAASLDRTLRSVFAQVIASPGDVNYFFACDTPGAITFDIPTLMKRYKERNIKAKYFSEHMFATLLQPELVDNLAAQLAAWRGVPLNTDFRPVTYFYNLMLWDQFTGRQLARFYHWIRWANIGWVVCLLAVLFALRLVYVLLTRHRTACHQRFNVLLIIFATGLAGLSWELILIFVFQNSYGYVYERVGLIIAAFMIGLVIGGGWMNHILKEASRSDVKHGLNLLAILAFANVVYSIFLPAFIWVLQNNRIQNMWDETTSLAIMVLTCVAGFLTGAPFPLASKIHLLLGGKAPRAAGLVDSMDHLGAFVGALFTGVLLIPLLGIVNTSFTIAGVNLAGLVLLLISPQTTPKSEHLKS